MTELHSISTAASDALHALDMIINMIDWRDNDGVIGQIHGKMLHDKSQTFWIQA